MKLFAKTLLLTVIFVLIPFCVGCMDNELQQIESEQREATTAVVDFVEDSQQKLEFVCGMPTPKGSKETTLLRRQPEHIVSCHDTLFFTLDKKCPKLTKEYTIEAAEIGLRAWAGSLFNVLQYTDDSDKAFLHLVFADTGEPIPPREGYIMSEQAGYAYYPPSNPDDTIYVDNGYAYFNNKYISHRILNNIDSLAWFIGHEGGHTLGLTHTHTKGRMMFFGLYDMGPAAMGARRLMREGYQCRKITRGLGLVEKPVLGVKDSIPLGLVLSGFGG